MLKSRLLQTLTDQSRKERAWKEWDIVAELEQREGDPAPRIQRYYCGMVIDWGNGEPPVEYGYEASAYADGPEYATGTHIVKIRIARPNFGYGVHVVFGYYNLSDIAEPICPQLKRVLKFNATNLRTLSYTFNRCFRLESVCPITHGEQITTATGAFMWTTHLRGAIIINSLRSTSSVGNFAYWSGAEEIFIGGGGMPVCTNVGSFARNAQNLRRAVLGKVPLAQGMTYMFGNCQSLEEYDLTGYGADTTGISYAFYYCEKLRGSLELPDMPNCTTAAYAFRNSGFDKITIGRTPLCTSYNNAFFCCENLRDVMLKDTTATTDAAYMFANCQSLEKVGLGGMGAVLTTMQEAFGNTGSLRQAIELPDMPNLTTMAAAFRYSGITSFKCGDLTVCTTINQAFGFCQSLKTVEIGDCPVLDTTYQCFINDASLERVKINAYGHTLNYCTATFQYCPSLKKVDGKFKLRPDGPSNASYYNTIFQGCQMLQHVPDIFPDNGWTTLRVANTGLTSLFNNCLQMKGTVPDLWTAGQPMYFPGTGNKTSSFTLCIRLDNYADIPLAWRSNVNVGD